MSITFDHAKNVLNRERHGIGLDEFRHFDSEPLVIRDQRRDYSEERFQAFGRIDGVGYMIAYVLRDDDVRLISFRRVREKELRKHGR